MDRNSYLAAMGIQVWKPRRSLPFAKQIVQYTLASDFVAEEFLQNSDVDWELLQQQVSRCSNCDLHQTRIKPVFGIGGIHVDLMVIGEAPGAEEEDKGEPFVGSTGHVLTQMLSAIGIAREDVFVTNILKCHPPNNRDPKQEEIRRCADYLNQQVNFIKPKLILAVGRVAAQSLLQSKEAISHLRGKVYEYGEDLVPLVATYHPAYLLRSPLEKSKVWADLVMVKKLLENRS